MYPELTPPEFKISNIESDSMQVHYFSKREGLENFVVGLLQGLAQLYDTQLKEIKLINSRANGFDHEIFLVKH